MVNLYRRFGYLNRYIAMSDCRDKSQYPPLDSHPTGRPFSGWVGFFWPGLFRFPGAPPRLRFTLSVKNTNREQFFREESNIRLVEQWTGQGLGGPLGKG